jgi:isopenicillin-N epimerase
MLPLRERWSLDPQITFLNHGSFGATPRAVLEEQLRLRQQMELEPVRFFVRELEPLIDDNRRRLARFLNARPDDLAFVTNATSAVNSILRSLDFRSGDELITTNHEYNACRNALDYVAARTGARVKIVEIPFPILSPEVVVERMIAALSERTRLVLIDHVTSQTALVFPVEKVVAECNRRGIEILIDGAHAPGMLPLDLERIGATYYAANLHKWVCAPKGAAFLWCREEKQREIRPTSISHGANSPRTDRSRFHLEFDWTGTADVTPWLCVGRALETMGEMLPGGWPEVMRSNGALALEARGVLCSALGIEAPAPEEMIWSMAAIPLPDGVGESKTSLYGDPLQDALLERYRIEVPIVPWPAPGKRVLRVSAQLYNTIDEYRRLAAAVVELLGEERR